MSEGRPDMGQLARRLQGQIEAKQRENQAKEVALRALKDAVHVPIPMSETTKPGGHNITWTDLDLATQQEHMVSVSQERRAIRIKFEALSQALKLVQESSAMSQVLVESPPAADPKVATLMERLKPLIKTVVKLEDDKVTTELAVHKSELELGQELSRLYEDCSAMTGAPSSTETRASSVPEDRELSGLRKQLQTERRRGQQMKVLVTKLLMSTPTHDFDEEFQSRVVDMILYCGKADYYA